MSEQKINIPVQADVSGAEQGIDRLDAKAKALTGTMGQLEQAAGRAGQAIERAGQALKVPSGGFSPDTPIEKALTPEELGVRPRPSAPAPPTPAPPPVAPQPVPVVVSEVKPSAAPTPPPPLRQLPGAQNTSMTPNAGAEPAMVARASGEIGAAASTTTKALQRLEFVQRQLSKELSTPVSEADAARFVGNFEKMRVGKILGTEKTRVFNNVESWWQGHGTLFKNEESASRHRRLIMAIGMQGTDYAREHGDDDAEDEGEGGGGGNGEASNVGRGGGGAKKAGSLALSFLKGGLALAGVGSVLGELGKGVSEAQAESITEDTLKRRMGDLGADFDRLKEQSRGASEGLGLTFVESARLAEQFDRAAGMLRDKDLRSGDFGASLRTAEGFARSEGIDPSTSASFFGDARRTGADGGDNHGDRKLALEIADAIAKGGYNGKGEEVLAAVEHYMDLAAKIGLRTPNTEGYLADLGGLLGEKRPGLDPGNAASILQNVDVAFRQGGALGESSRTAIYTALKRPGMDFFDTDALMKDGGWWGSLKSVFGKGKDGKPGLFAGAFKGDAEDTETNGARVMRLVSQLAGGNPKARNHMLMRIFNLPSYDQAEALGSIVPGDATDTLMKRVNIEPTTISATSIAGLARIANAQDTKDLQGILTETRNRKDLTQDQARSLDAALKTQNATAIQDALARVIKENGQTKTDGEQTRDSLAKVNSTLD